MPLPWWLFFSGEGVWGVPAFFRGLLCALKGWPASLSGIHQQGRTFQVELRRRLFLDPPAHDLVLLTPVGKTDSGAIGFPEIVHQVILDADQILPALQQFQDDVFIGHLSLA